ncbi:MAG TPA: DNA adenine methylase [Chitinophagaceae bacterium]|nr:DNA adenine methylase [Chitinophagaceae bacterium]
MTINLIDLKTFPSTRYQGSKRKILPWIYNSLKDLRFYAALDACGGSASVSYLLKKMGKAVTYNDKLHFNYLIGKAIIENSQYKLTDEDITSLKNINPEITYRNFIERIFKGVYYLNKENKWLDRVTTNIVNINHYQPQELEYKKALAYYALFQSSLIKRPFNLFHRKNLNIRTSDVVRKFGNKTTWEKSFDEYFLKFATEANNLVFNSGQQCNAINQSIFDIDEYGYDLVYIDIPYIRKDGSNESSNYLRCYHFLEGLSKYQEWSNLIDYDSINLRLKNIEEQNDFTKENIYEVVDQILGKFRKSIIVFSYKIGGMPSINFIKQTMEKLGKRVHSVSRHYSYALNHQNGEAEKNREVLVIGI